MKLKKIDNFSHRTQDQLGYIVFSGVRKANGAKGLRIIVQSAKALDYVDERIEKFLESMIVRRNFLAVTFEKFNKFEF